MAFSPDGIRLASGSENNTVKLWNPATGRELATLSGHTGGVRSVAFSPDGTRLASGSWDKTVKVWDAATGRELATFSGHTEAVTSVAFSPDGARLASGAGDHTVKSWDAVTHRENASTEGPPENKTNLKPGSPTEMPDLAQRLRLGLLHMKGTTITAPSLNRNLLANASFPLLPVRRDTLGRLADPHLSSAVRAELQMKFLAEVGQSLSATVLWRRFQEDPSIDAGNNPVIRRLYLGLLIQACKHSLPKNPGKAVSLLDEISSTITRETMDHPVVPLAMMSLVKILLATGSSDLHLGRERLLERLKELAPPAWWESLSDHASQTHTTAGVPDELKMFRARLLLALTEQYPHSMVLARNQWRTMDGSEPSWIATTEKLLGLPEAKAQDFIEAAHTASRQPSLKASAKRLLEEAETRFPQEPQVFRLAGWCRINLKDAPGAVRSFETALAKIGEDKTSMDDLLTGLALAQSLNGQQKPAMDTFRKLIESGRALQPPKNWVGAATIANLAWPEAEKKPLEALRAATLKKHPELVPDVKK